MVVIVAWLLVSVIYQISTWLFQWIMVSTVISLEVTTNWCLWHHKNGGEFIGRLGYTAKLQYIELRYFEVPVLSNNGKWPGHNQCKCIQKLLCFIEPAYIEASPISNALFGPYEQWPCRYIEVTEPLGNSIHELLAQRCSWSINYKQMLYFPTSSSPGDRNISVSRLQLRDWHACWVTGRGQSMFTLFNFRTVSLIMLTVILLPSGRFSRRSDTIAFKASSVHLEPQSVAPSDVSLAWASNPL